MFVRDDVVFFVQLLREFHETNGKAKKKIRVYFDW
jgi:hypothetical protein